MQKPRDAVAVFNLEPSAQGADAGRSVYTRMRARSLHLLAGVIGVFLLIGCGPSMDQVPSSESIRKRMGRFLVNPDDIQGVYRNLDVDSLVFTYSSKVEGEAAFWSGLEERLKDSRWTEADRLGAVREYRRSYRKGEVNAERPDMAIFSSFEVARVAFNTESRTAVVAYVQADGSSKDTKFEDTGESKWAEKAIWPRFRDLILQLNTEPSDAPNDNPAKSLENPNGS
ncbi:MAG: hypothetical protein ACK4UN_06380 [Limisphaerales bacterium]